MLPDRRQSWHRWIIVLGVLCLLGAPGSGYSVGGSSPSVPFTPNPLFTTPFGPAYADIVLRPSNFLPCFGGPIALCYYSGPGPDTTCTLTADGKFANCKCYEIPSGPYFVDINAILNLEIYLLTVKKCGPDGVDCRLPNSAPVCHAINNNTLIPGADVISTFSFALNSVPGFEISPTNCPLSSAPYAGCMTAPCKRTDERVTVGGSSLTIDECACPTFVGPYQVRIALDPDGTPPQCVLGSNLVWSAAFNPLAAKGTFPSPSCFPDAPGDAGCPLLSALPGVSPPQPIIPSAPADVSCGKVCAEYRQSRQKGVEAGFTCDATLCTATGKDFNLVQDACSGLQDGRISGILKLETEVGCSCCASQICGCKPDKPTNAEIFILNQRQRDRGIVPQCDQNGTLCGAQP